ncbi:MAG: hypothetical protein EP307_10375 [Rhodobacteraceae bacterium]|nr:MAG: hypothetical protein EP307_10375 [Paracoccaceae bacterium]
MEPERAQFAKRLRRLARKHDAMSRGYETRIRPDGLLIVRPRRRSSGISLKSVIIFLAAFILFKGLVLAEVGQGTYENRLVAMQSGTWVEQAGAVVMQIDPATRYVAGFLAPFLR